MPEAVVSNSTAAPSRKAVHQEQFDDIEAMLKAMSMMTLNLFEYGGDCKSWAYGIDLINRRIHSELREVATSAMAHVIVLPTVGRFIGERPDDIDIRLFDRVNKMVEEEAESAGANLSAMVLVEVTIRLYNKITREMEKPRAEQFEAALRPEARKLFDWYKESDQPAQKPSTIRDRFIMDSVRNGYEVSDIAQVFNLRRSAIEKAIGRLSVPVARSDDNLENRAG